MRALQKNLALILAVALCLSLGVFSAVAAPEATMEQTVILDNDLVTLTVTDYDPDGEWGPVFEILMESKTDQNISVYMRNVSINGVMCNSYCSEQVPAGKKVYGDMDWDLEQLAFCGINYIETVSASVEISDADTYDTLAEDTVSWSVTVGETDVPAVEAPTYDFEPIEVLTGDAVLTIVNYDPTGYSYDETPALTIYMENNTDALLSFSADDVTINGFMCDPYWSESVAPGMAAYSQMGWSNSTLESSHLTSVDSISFTAKVRDYEHWDTLDSQPATVTVNENAGEQVAAEGTVLADNDVLTVTVTGFDPDDDWGPSFEILVENKTDKTLYTGIENISLNGIMCGNFSLEVAPGMKGFDELQWGTENLEACGIHYVQDVKGVLTVYDAANYDTLVETDVAWSVESEQTDETDEEQQPAVERMHYDHGIEEQPILTGDVAATLLDYDPLGYYQESPALIIYAENNTDKTVRFRVDDISANGFMLNSSSSQVVTPGSAAYLRVGLWKDDLEASHIDTVEQLELTLEVSDNTTGETLNSGSLSLDLTGAAAEAPAA